MAPPKSILDILESLHIASQFSEAHSSLKTIFKDEYEEQAKPVRNAIRGVMKAGNKSVMGATLALMEKFADDEATTMWIMAAAVDVLLEEKEKNETL